MRGTATAGPPAGGRLQLLGQDSVGPHRFGTKSSLIYDPHCHLDDPELAGQFELCCRESLAAGVAGALIPGYGPDRWQRQSELLRSDAFPMWGAFGLHPWAVDPRHDADFHADILQRGWRDHASRWGAKLLAIGEFGLDRSRRQPLVPLQLQRDIFRQHLALAHSERLPVILHLVRADGAAQELMAEVPPLCGGVIHAFSSQPETIPAYAELGLSFSYGSGLLRFEKVRRSLLATPAELIMFETDGPQGLPKDFPQPRGPKYLGEIVAAASQVLGKSVEYLLARHQENCARLFGFGTGQTSPCNILEREIGL